MGAGMSIPALETSASQVAALPQNFRVEQKKSLTKVALNIVSTEGAKIRVVSLPRGYEGPMVLHSGPDVEAPPVSVVAPAGRWKADFDIHLPAVPELGVAASVETLRNRFTLKAETFWFGMVVGRGDSKCAEKFEWRRSHGDDIKSVGASRWGWKLVRLGPSMGADAPVGAGSGSGSGTGAGFSSDGKEVVAVWAEAKLSMSQIGEFQLRGSGATGELGAMWHLVAAMSAMSIWQHETRNAMRASAS